MKITALKNSCVPFGISNCLVLLLCKNLVSKQKRAVLSVSSTKQQHHPIIGVVYLQHSRPTDPRHAAVNRAVVCATNSSARSSKTNRSLAAHALRLSSLFATASSAVAATTATTTVERRRVCSSNSSRSSSGSRSEQASYARAPTERAESVASGQSRSVFTLPLPWRCEVE